MDGRAVEKVCRDKVEKLRWRQSSVERQRISSSLRCKADHCRPAGRLGEERVNPRCVLVEDGASLVVRKGKVIKSKDDGIPVYAQSRRQPTGSHSAGEDNPQLCLLDERRDQLLG